MSENSSGDSTLNPLSIAILSLPDSTLRYRTPESLAGLQEEPPQQPADPSVMERFHPEFLHGIRHNSRSGYFGRCVFPRACRCKPVRIPVRIIRAANTNLGGL